MAAINFPDAPTNGQIFESGGMSWTYVAGIGWTLNSAIVEAGSGFTFIADTMPLPVNVGDTWFDSSTGASGGTSWVAVEEGPAGVSEKVWVQFAPGIGAVPSMGPSMRRFTTGGFTCTPNIATTIYIQDTASDYLGGDIGNPRMGAFTMSKKGIYTLSLTLNWSLTWGMGTGLVLRLFSTRDAGATVYQELGNQIVGPTPWGVTTNTITIDQNQTLADMTNLEYMMQVWNYMASPISYSAGVATVSRVSERK